MGQMIFHFESFINSLLTLKFLIMAMMSSKKTAYETLRPRTFFAGARKELTNTAELKNYSLKTYNIKVKKWHTWYIPTALLLVMGALTIAAMMYLYF